MTRDEVDELWHADDLVQIGMRADAIRAQLEPFGIVTYCLSSEEDAHNRLATHGQTRDVPLSFGAAPGGLCAFEEHAHNRLAARRSASLVPGSVGAAGSGLCASDDLSYPLLVSPNDSVDILMEHLDQARESGMPAVQPVFGNNVTGTEYLKLVALCRLYLTGTVLVQAAPALVGLKVAQLALRFGANDLGNTNGGGMEETFRRLIRDAGFVPKQRDAQYKILYVD